MKFEFRENIQHPSCLLNFYVNGDDLNVNVKRFCPFDGFPQFK